MSIVLFWGFVLAASVILGQGLRVKTLKKELKRVDPAALTTAKPKSNHRLEHTFVGKSIGGNQLWYAECCCESPVLGGDTESEAIKIWKKHRDLRTQLELESDDVYAKLRKELDDKQKELDEVKDNCICKDLT